MTAFIDGLPDFTIGVEEEYLIVDPDTRDLVANPPRALLHECEAAVAPEVGSVSPELLRSQDRGRHQRVRLNRRGSRAAGDLAAHSGGNAGGA